jgi:hypothetical protein
LGKIEARPVKALGTRLALNVTKFFRASRPVYRASRPF